MKNLNFLSNLCGLRRASLSGDVGYDCRSTVVRPSFDCRSTLLKLVTVLVLILTIGSGNAWATDYQLIKSTDDLEVGAHYVLGASYNSTYYFIKTETNTNNRKLVTATVTNEKVSSVTGLMTFTLGGDATNGWTFKTDNYTGTAGYLNATSTTSSNYLKVVATLDNYAKFSVNITAAGVATIQCKGKSSRHIMYLNGTTCIACYSSQSGAQYVKLGIYKEVAAACSTPPTVGSSLTSVSATVNSITATVPISAIGGCNITENGLVYSTTNSTPTVGGTGCTKVTVTACGSTAANKTVTISDLTCGQGYYVRGYATNAAGTSYTNVTTQSTSACPVYTVTLKDDNSTYTQASYGASVTLPSRAGCAGYTFAGWTKTWVAPQSSWTTTAPTIIPAGSYTPSANENLYAVYTKEEGGGTTDYSKTETFENQGASTTYNSTQTYSAANSNASLAWSMYYGTVSTNAVLTGSKSAQMRWYSSATSNIPNIKTTTAVSGLQTLTFNAAVGNTNIKMKVEKSTDGSNWTVVASNVSMSTSKTEYSYDISGTIGTGYYIRIGVDGTNSTAPSSGNYTFRVDDVKFDYQEGGGSTTYYISVPNCCTAPTGVATTAVGNTSVTLSITDAADAGNYDIYISASSTAPTSETTPTTTVNTKTPTISSGLSACNTYYLWARAKCSESSKSSWVALTGNTFSTTGTAPTVGAGGSTALSATSGSVSCSSGITTIGETITSYGYVWADGTVTTTPTLANSSHELGTTYTVASTAFSSYTITGLTSGHTYYVRPYATNCGGTSYGTVTSFTTSFKTIYFQPQDSWTAASAKTFVWNATSSAWIAGAMTVGTGCYAGYLYIDVPIGCNSVNFVRMKPAAESGAWSGDNFYNQSKDANISTYDKVVMTGWDNNQATVSVTSNFVIPTFTITYGGNSPTSGSMSNSSVTCGNNQTLTSNAYSKTGFSFGGWTADVDVTISGSPVTAGSTIANGATIQSVSSDINLTAIWSCVEPEISAQPSGANYTVGDSPSALSVTASLASGTLTYLWKVSTNGGSTWSNASGTNNAATYSGASLSTAAAGTIKFKCVLTNSTGSCSIESNVATIEVAADPREKFTLLTSSNIGQLSDGAKVVLVHAGMFANHAMKNVTGSKGFDAVEEGDTEFEISGTTLYLEEGNNVQVLNVGESGAYFSLSTGSAYLQNSSDKYLTTTTTTPLPDAAKWAISVDAGDNTAAITSQGTQGQDIRYNSNQALTAQPFRCYASSTSDDIYIYFQPSADPTISASPTSLTGFTYVVGNGPSDAQDISVSGLNLTGDLTVKAPTNYQVSTDGGSTWSTSGGTKTISVTPPTLSATTVKVRLVSGLSRGTYNDATGVKVYGGGVLEANAKTVSLAGNVTNAFHTVTISAGANGSVSPSGAQSVEEGQTLAVTATPNTGYSFSSWTVTGAGSSCTSSASGTFTMGTVNATLTANFSQIMVSGITVSGDATIKTSTSKTYTATVTPAGALTKTVTWSVINGTGTATINSSTGELTAGSPGTVTVRATANDGSGVYGELAVTVQDVVRYKFVKMTSTPSPWEDDDYLIVNEGSNTILSGSDPVNKATGTAGEGNTTSVTINTSTSPYSITLEDNKDDAFHISYVSTKGYLVQGVGGDHLYVVRAGSATGGSSVKELSSSDATNTRYWYSIAYNKLTYTDGDHMGYNSASYRFYTSSTADNLVLYRLETAYTITCTTPSNGTLTSDMGSAASGTTVTLTVTPSTGYELNTLTITKEGGGTVTPTKVDETHYTFTMPKDNVTVTATFVTLCTKDIIFHTPECVTTPSTLSGKATGATVTLPSEPAGTPDGFTFEGWVMASVDDPVSVKPTTYAPGDYTIPSGAANINMYALYSEGELSVSGSFSNITTAGNLTVPGYYIIGMASSGSQSVLSNTLSGKHIAPATVNPSSCSSAAAVWEITKPDSYWRIRNISTGTYVASTGTEKEATLIADASSDAAKWTVTATDAGYRFANKLLDDNSATRKYLGYAAASTDYRTMNLGAGGDVLYLFKAGGGVVTDNTTYTTDPKCYCDYRLMVSTNTGSTWTEAGCFTKVEPEDASDHEWQLANYTMPAHSSSILLKVQKNGEDVSQTASWQAGWVPLAELQNEGSCSYKAFDVEGAVVTLRIYDNYPDANFYMGMLPTYQITHGVQGGGAWNNEQFEYVETVDGHVVYETAITTAPAGYFANNNYKFYVGARKSDGTTKFADKNNGSSHQKSVTQVMNTMGGMTTDVGGRSGVYRMWANYYNNSVDGDNWYCQFIPYYVVYYHDVNGNEITEWRDVLTSSSTTVHGYAAGQTGWATSQGGSASATYNAGSVITPAADIHLYQVASTYTVTFSVAEESSSYDGTSVKVIQGQSMTLPTITFSCALYPTFVGWVTGDAIPASDPEVQTEEPATFIGAGGDSYIPTGNVTLRALYGHNCDGNAGWQKQTSIRAGKYIIVAGTYGFAGLESAVSSTTNQGSYLSDVTVVDGTTVSSSTGMHEVEVLLGENGTFAIEYSDGQYMENSSGYFNGNVTNLANAYRWKMNASGQIYDAEATTMFLQINNSNHKFKCYAGTQSTYANLFRYTKTGYYTTDPTCVVPTEFTLSFNGNKPDGWSGDVSGVPSDIVRTFSPYPTLATAIDLGSISNPTLTGWLLTGWNTAANGSGTPYALDDEITEYTGSGMTLYAQWERVYSVTLYDNGVERTTLVEASAGAGVTLPSGNNCTPSSEFTFVGWTESAVELNADPVRPASATLHAAGSYSPTDDITLYSVYSRSVSGCDDFAAGVSGAYKFTNKGSSDYALVTANANRYDKAASGTAEIFYIAYSDAKSAYTIRTSLGYLGWSGASGSEQLTKNNATPYYWDIKEGTGGNAGYWNFQPIGASTKQFSGNGTYFNFGSNSTKYYIQLTKNAMTYYYNTALCGDAKITFHDGGGSISGTPTTPAGASWNSTTHVLSGLEDCDKITTFPTATYAGWTFVGWSTEDYTNSGKHTAGTVHYSDENASTDEPDASIIYKNDGNSFVVRGGSMDLYPIFTRFPDNEPFDLDAGGRYYLYYLEPGSDDGYGAPARRYAGEWDGTKRYTATTTCANATEFEFTKVGDVWHIQNTANSKWLGGKSSDDWLVENNSLGTLTDWTITIRSGNQFNATCQSGRQISVFENFFMDYSSNNIGTNPGYHCVYLGSCEERIFSSEPHAVPTIDLVGSPMITSSVGQRVRATEAMTLSGSHLAGATKITLSGTNLTFATSATATPAANLEVTVTSGNVAETSIYVYYTPGGGDTSDGIENIIITATDNGTVPAEAKANVSVRHLPADFVIAAKWGDKWYALPNTCNDSKSSTVGVVITVDNDNDPTCATAAPSTAKWGLRQTKQPARITAGYADRLTFTERGTTATADNQQALYNYNSADVYTNAQWTNYANTNPDRYEWIPVTSDFKDYTLANAYAPTTRFLILRNDGEFKAQNSNQAYDGKVRLLPATFYEEAPVQIVEWKSSAVVVMYTGTETSAKAKVGTSSETSAQTLSTRKVTHGIYELTTGTSLTSNAGKNLLLTFGDTKKVFEIPWIINGSSNAATGHDKQDVVILKNGKLTAQSTKYSFRNVYVYGGGKLKIASGTSLGVNNIILRAGGISTNGTGGSATYEYVYPQVELGGTLTSTKTDIKYEYITDYDHWFHLCLPFNASLSSITYPQEYYGANVAANNKGSWYIKRYDGAIRSTGSYDAWKDIEKDDPAKTEVTAGFGYIFWGAPKKVTIGGDTQRQKWGIQRMTMSTTAAAATTAETNNKNISVDSYSEVATSTKPNDQGWNLVGNPFMANLTGLTSESLIAGKLVHTDTEPWDGKWKNNGDGTRYVTIPDNHFDNYVAKTTATASGAGDFMPGRTFFVQIAEGASTLTFATVNRASLMPALFAKTEQSVDIETGIVMSDESKHDEVNFWIKDGKTAEYEYNADYPKTPNNSHFNIYGVHSHGDLSWIAISPEIAEGSMAIGYQVPTASEYRLSLSETYVSDKIEQLLVTDHEMSPEITTNLMVEDYIFQVNEAETNNTRFTVSIKIKSGTNTATDIDDIRGDSDHPIKFLYRDKIYILRGGQIYDTTGKQVREINK